MYINPLQTAFFVRQIKIFLAKFTFINFSNLTLLILALATVVYCLIQIDARTKTANSSTLKTLQIQVLDSKRNLFNQEEYSVWSNNGFWLATSKNLLTDGKNYIVKAKLKTFSPEEQKDIYNLGSGYLGRLKIEKVIGMSKSCGLLCNMVKITKDVQKFIDRKLFAQICHENKIITEFIAGKKSCQDVYALSYGLILGGSDKFSKPSKQNLKTLGLTHLIAVSGFQVGLLLTLVEKYISHFGLSRKGQFMVFLILNFGLILLVGLQPPVLRSSVSLVISLGSLIFLGRQLSMFRSLIYSAIFMLVLNPMYLLSISFQLSFVACLSLISLELKFKDSWKDVFVESLKTALLPFLFTLPIITNLSGGVSPLAILTNMIIAPFIPYVTYLNFFSLLPIVGDIFGFLVTFVQTLFIFSLNLIGQNTEIIGIAKFSAWGYFVYYTLLLLIIKSIEAVSAAKTIK